MMQRDYQTITATAGQGVATLTLNLPERKNPLGPLMVSELIYALDDAKADEPTRVIVLTGAGAAFSAGGDLKQMGGRSDAPGLEPRGDYVDLLLRFEALGKPTVARVPGYAMGGGLGLVACCDFAVGCESAVLGTPEVHVGLFPMMIMAVLQRIVPRRRLLAMMLLGEKMSAREALEVGLLSHVVPDDDLDATVETLSSRLAALSPTALRMGLRAFSEQAERPLSEALPKLRGELFALLGTEDAREGLLAFAQQREPQWTGR